MPRSHLKHWFNQLAPADAARVVAAVEQLRHQDWSLITRTPGARLILRWAQKPDRHLPFGQPGDHTAAALATLNRQLSPAIALRLRSDATCRTCVLRAAAQALLDDDVELSQGLLRRLVDATLGFEALGNLTEVHPKSLIRMLGPAGNPSARHLGAIIARVAQWHGVRLTVDVDRILHTWVTRWT